MKVIVVYGCSCSGKSTYVKEHMTENDIVYDYDRLLSALTSRDSHTTEKHAAHNLITRLRYLIISNLKDDKDIQRIFIITRWPTDGIKKMLDGFEVEYKYLQANENECIKRLKNDDSRPDKEQWEKVIHQWHLEHGEKRAQTMKEIRIAKIKAEIRANDPAGTDGLYLVGMPIVYDTPTVIHDPAGAYTEIIQTGALDGADLSDVRLLYNHDLNKVPLARTPRTMQLEVVPAGLNMRAALPDTGDAKAVHEAVKRGDLSGMSFAFVVPQGGDQYDAATNTRTITKISKIYEISVVPFPAYPTASVEARNARSAGLKTLEAKKRARILINQILKERI